MAPNDYIGGTGNKSQARPFADESSQSTPHILTAVQARQGVISGRIVKILGVLHLARTRCDGSFLSRRLLNERAVTVLPTKSTNQAAERGVSAR